MPPGTASTFQIYTGFFFSFFFLTEERKFCSQYSTNCSARSHFFVLLQLLLSWTGLVVEMSSLPLCFTLPFCMQLSGTNCWAQKKIALSVLMKWCGATSSTNFAKLLAEKKPKLDFQPEWAMSRQWSVQICIFLGGLFKEMLRFVIYLNSYGTWDTKAYRCFPRSWPRNQRKTFIIVSA